MCAQQTATDMPSAGLNIAELADQYTRPLRGIGHQYRLTREEQEGAVHGVGRALVDGLADAAQAFDVVVAGRAPDLAPDVVSVPCNENQHDPKIAAVARTRFVMERS